MNEIEKFNEEKKYNIEKLRNNIEIQRLGKEFIEKTLPYKYTYNFTWMGRPIIQTPQDMIAMQEIIWDVKPDLIIETGIAHGGSLIFYSSILELIGKGEVLGIDIDIRPHNRIEIEKHPMSKNIIMFEGSSISDEIIEKTYKFAQGKRNIMVLLDSNHTHDHVLKEIQLYAPLVSVNSYLIVFDTTIDDINENFFVDRPWGKNNNPKTAVKKFLETNNQFIIDKSIESKLLITVASDGFLKRIK